MRLLLTSSHITAALVAVYLACAFANPFVSIPPPSPASFTLEDAAPAARIDYHQVNFAIELISSTGQKQYQHVTTANCMYSASYKRAHFGPGPDASVKKLVIRWPSGIM